MPEILNFCGHTLSTSAARVASYESFAMNQDVETEEEIVDEVTQVAKRAIGKGTLSLTVPLHVGLGVDVFGEYLSWRALADSGAKGALYVAGRMLDDFEWMITSVGLADPMAGPGGQVYRGRLQLGFDGCLPKEQAEAKKKSGGGKKKAPDEGADLTQKKGTWVFNTEGILVRANYNAYSPEEALRLSMLNTRVFQDAVKDAQSSRPPAPPEM